MKITTLIENLVYQPGLVSEHGLSIYIDTGRRRILLDAGQSSSCLANAESLGIDINNVDAVVISHGHYDHTGGLNAFLHKNAQAKVYLKKEALLPKYNSSRNFIGIPAIPEEYEKRLRFVEEVTEIDEGVFIVPTIPIVHEEDTSFSYFYTDRGEGLVDDTFEDELFLAIVSDNRLSVFSSCSHRGISNILEAAQRLFSLPVDLVTGGFHLKNAPKEQLETVIKYLARIKPKKVGICHCTGIENFPEMTKAAGENVFYNYTGNIIKI